MTAEDAPNASDEPLAVTKPPEDLAAQPTGNASRTRRAPPPAQRQPSMDSIYGCSRRRPSRFDPLESPAHHHRRYSIPIARGALPRFSPIRF